MKYSTTRTHIRMGMLILKIKFREFVAQELRNIACLYWETLAFHTHVQLMQRSSTQP